MAKSRRGVNPRRDKRMFRHTARKTKKINLAPAIMRGGIRL